MAVEKESVAGSVDKTKIENKTSVEDKEAETQKTKDVEENDSKTDEKSVAENGGSVVPDNREKTEDNRSEDKKPSADQPEVTRESAKKKAGEDAAPVSRRTRSSLSKAVSSDVVKRVESTSITKSASEDIAKGKKSDSTGVSEEVVVEESCDSVMDTNECYAEVVEEADGEGDVAAGDEAQIVEEMECDSKVVSEDSPSAEKVPSPSTEKEPLPTTEKEPLPTTEKEPLPSTEKEATLSGEKEATLSGEKEATLSGEKEATLSAEKESLPSGEKKVSDTDSKDLTAAAVAEKPSTPKGQKKTPNVETTNKSAKSPIKEAQKQSQAATKMSPKDSLKHGSKVAIKSVQVKKEKSSEQDDKDSGERIRRITPCDKTLWVSSISNKTRAADLKALFSKHGKVSAAKILTNSKTPGARCYGLVTLLSSKDAMACIKNLHHTELHGRVINVEKTRMALKQPSGTTTLKTSVRVEDKGKEIKKDVKSSDEKKGEKADCEKKVDPKKEAPKGDAKATEDKKEDKVAVEKDTKKDDARKKDARKSDPKKEETKNDDKKDAAKKDEGRTSRSERSSRTSTNSTTKNKRSSKEGDNQSRDKRQKGRSRSPLNRRKNYSKSPERRDRHGHIIRTPNSFARSQGRGRSGQRDSSNTKVDSDNEDREIRRRNRQETLRLERERDRLKAEREQLEREKARVLRIEKEQQRIERDKLEREMTELRKYSRMLDMGDSRDTKRALDREAMWDDRKRSRSHHSPLPQRSLGRVGDVDRRDRRDALTLPHSDRYYDSSTARGLDRPYHSGGVPDTINPASAWGSQVSSDHNKYGVSPTIPGIWARMDVPPPVPDQRWGAMEQPRMQPPGPIGHPQPPPTNMPQSGNQVVMFVPGNPNNSTGNMTNQYQNNRFNTNNMRRF